MTRQTETITVLFADISDSTKLYATLGDNAARVVVDDYLSLISRIVGSYKGRIVKNIGDAIMCVFKRTDDAVLAASEMQQAVNGGASADYDVQIHIGLQCGPVLMENDDVFGDTVNAAAYLTTLATAGQILTTEATERNLSPRYKNIVRPVFKSTLKGSSVESTVYQVVWHKDVSDLTEINLQTHKSLPGDEGCLLVVRDDLTLFVTQQRGEISIGRGAECDVVVSEKLASRKHVSIRLLRTHFYLVDHSLNGTFVRLQSGEEVHVLRGELLLDGSGTISPGRKSQADEPGTITYTRDRRSTYRA